MLEKAGVVVTEFSEPDAFTDFRESLRQYRDGEEWSRDEMLAFQAQQTELRERTIASADIICCSLANAANNQIITNFPADLIILDEAARDTDSQPNQKEEGFEHGHHGNLREFPAHHHHGSPSPLEQKPDRLQCFQVGDIQSSSRPVPLLRPSC